MILAMLLSVLKLTPISANRMSGYSIRYDHLILIPFKAGNIRKAEEAEALYSCILISSILDDKLFSSELEAVAIKYNFASVTEGKGQMSFANLMKSWQNINSVMINVIIAACRRKITNQKKQVPFS